MPASQLSAETSASFFPACVPVESLVLRRPLRAAGCPPVASPCRSRSEAAAGSSAEGAPNALCRSGVSEARGSGVAVQLGLRSFGSAGTGKRTSMPRRQINALCVFRQWMEPFPKKFRRASSWYERIRLRRRLGLVMVSGTPGRRNTWEWAALACLCTAVLAKSRLLPVLTSSPGRAYTLQVEAETAHAARDLQRQ